MLMYAVIHVFFFFFLCSSDAHIIITHQVVPFVLWHTFALMASTHRGLMYSKIEYVENRSIAHVYEHSS
jgi:hypothetical protein